ncbi:MAG: PEGA domain-containing protein [Desulfovibrio sp.]|jgi:hypothetical protein
MSHASRLLPCLLFAAVLSGCAGVQKVPVSTDPGGAVVYLDGLKVCESTPCSVEMKKDQNHLLTIVRDGYRQRDITMRLAQSPAGGTTLTPEIVTVRLRTPDQPDISDKDAALGTAIDLGTEVLQRVLEQTRKDLPPAK